MNATWIMGREEVLHASEGNFQSSTRTEGVRPLLARTGLCFATEYRSLGRDRLGDPPSPRVKWIVYKRCGVVTQAGLLCHLQLESKDGSLTFARYSGHF